MALSLARGSDDEEAAADPVVEEPVVVVPDGVDQALTADENIRWRTGGDDTFRTSATMTADDNIVDTSSTE